MLYRGITSRTGTSEGWGFEGMMARRYEGDCGEKDGGVLQREVYDEAIERGYDGAVGRDGSVRK